MGYCYLNMDKYKDAVTEYRKATTLQPGYIVAWNNLGDAYEKLKTWKEALHAYESAFELAPDNDIARLGVERLRRKSERRSSSAA